MSVQIIHHEKKVKAKKKHVCNYCCGAILPGETYERYTLKYDDLYTWKAHPRCTEIAEKLRMFDECDYGDGLTADDFQECIYEEFNVIWNEKDLDYYESDDFVIPKFQEQLDFVCNHYLQHQGLQRKSCAAD
jgi:hypothetical protein